MIAMDIDQERLDFCRQWLDHIETVSALEDPIQRIKELTNGEMPAVVYDATGNARSMMNSFEYTAHGGTLVYVGLVKTDSTFSDPDFHKKELTLMGSRHRRRFQASVKGCPRWGSGCFALYFPSVQFRKDDC